MVVHLQHTPGREETSASVRASASGVFGRGQAPPSPAGYKRQGTEVEEQRRAHLTLGQGGRIKIAKTAPGRGRVPYLLQMLQWWVRAGLGAMHFLQMDTPVRSFLACAQVEEICAP